MTFLHPTWLLALLPWAGVVLYLLWGRRKKVTVPFLELWRIPVQGHRPRRRIAPPPLALALALLAPLLALLAAARPAVTTGRGATGSGPLTLIVDRGITMSAFDQRSGNTRYRSVAGQVKEELQRAATSKVELFVVPAAGGTRPVSQRTDARNFTTLLNDAQPAALDTAEAVVAIVRDRLTETTGPVILISDADLGPLASEPRVVQARPDVQIRSAGITALAARDSPRPQVMVRVRNDTAALASATLRVKPADDATPLEQIIQLPAAGQERSFFFDVARLGDTVTAELVAPGDDLPADDRVWLVRDWSWPELEARQPVGALERLVALYRELRPPRPGSRKLYLVTSAAQLPPGAPGVIVNPGGTPVESRTGRPAAVVPHPVTNVIRNWTALDLPTWPTGPPPAGFTPVVSTADGTALVAVKESPDARQVWVAIDPNRWANNPEHVVFWAAVFDWAGGGGGEAFTSHPLDARDPEWQPAPSEGTSSPLAHDPVLWPGVFVRQDGARHAFHASPVRATADAASPADWRTEMRSVTAISGRRDVSPIVLLAACGALLGAAATWRRRVPPPAPLPVAPDHPDFVPKPARRRRARRHGVHPAARIPAES